MPYVDLESRAHLDEAIEDLCNVIKSDGELNYAISRITTASLVGSRPSYESIARAIGTLEAVKLEFYRRVAVPYEEKKRSVNGDVPEYFPF